MNGHIARKEAKGGRYRYYPVVELPPDPHTGKRRRKWHKGYARKKDAEAALARLVTAAHDGTYVEPSKVTVAQFIERWLPGVKATVKRSTWQSYRSTLESYVVPRIGGIALQQLAGTHLRSMYADLADNGRTQGDGGLSPTTVRYVHVVLKRALRDAVRDRLVAQNPADRVDAPRASSKGSKDLNVWTAEELRAFLAHVEEDRLAGLWLLAATTGMRRGELLGLRWEDVDLDARRLSIVQTYVTRGHYSDVGFVDPKTDGSRRTISLDPATVTGLRRHRTRQAEERLAWGPAWDDTGLVFTSEDGTPIHPARVSRRFLRLARHAGLPRIRFHDVRHTYATTALRAGVPPKIVSNRLGHSTISITLDTYSHVLPRMDSDAADAIASLILGNVAEGGAHS